MLLRIVWKQLIFPFLLSLNNNVNIVHFSVFYILFNLSTFLDLFILFIDLIFQFSDTAAKVNNLKTYQQVMKSIYTLQTHAALLMMSGSH